MAKVKSTRSSKSITNTTANKARDTQKMRGLVVAAKLPKTVTVIIESKKTHPMYGKSFRRSKKYLVHDEVGVAEGDVVEIVSTRPMSKNKYFQVLKVVGKDIATIVSERLQEEAEETIAGIMPEEPEKSENQTVSKPEEKEKKAKKKEKK